MKKILIGALSIITVQAVAQSQSQSSSTTNTTTSQRPSAKIIPGSTPSINNGAPVQNVSSSRDIVPQNTPIPPAGITKPNTLNRNSDVPNTNTTSGNNVNGNTNTQRVIPNSNTSNANGTNGTSATIETNSNNSAQRQTATGSSITSGAAQIGSTRNSVEAGGTGVGSNGSVNNGTGTTGNVTAGSAINNLSTGNPVTDDTRSNTANSVNNNSNAATTIARPAGMPDAVFSTFSAANAAASNITWSNENGKWSAKYMLGDTWLQSNYNANGRRIDTRTDLPLTDPNLIPKGVATYKDQNSGLKIEKIIRVETPGATEQYEIKTSDGKTVTVNKDGSLVKM